MILQIITKIAELHEMLFKPIDSFIISLPLAHWMIHAIVDTIHLIPFLFIIFLFIEFMEQYCSNKINGAIKKTEKLGVIVGSLASLLPQCGFSVIAASLYSKRFITRGILIAVFLTTSDETIPILLANPSKAYLIIPIVIIKLIVGIIIGYLVDWIAPTKTVPAYDIPLEEGCCKHNLKQSKKIELIVHPIKHTFNIVLFILAVTLVLNYCFVHYDVTAIISKGKLIQPMVSSLVGLIPNCAISVGITVMLIKGTIPLGTAIAGLLSNAGLGLLVLFKNNNLKDNLIIIAVIYLVGSISGYCLNLIHF